MSRSGRTMKLATFLFSRFFSCFFVLIVGMSYLLVSLVSAPVLAKEKSSNDTRSLKSTLLLGGYVGVEPSDVEQTLNMAPFFNVDNDWFSFGFAGLDVKWLSDADSELLVLLHPRFSSSQLGINDQPATLDFGLSYQRSFKPFQVFAEYLHDVDLNSNA